MMMGWKISLFRGQKLRRRISLLEDAPTEKEDEVEHELDESLLIINFASCTSDELIEFMLDFFNLTDEELLHFCVYTLLRWRQRLRRRQRRQRLPLVLKRLCGWGRWIRKRTIRFISKTQYAIQHILFKTTLTMGFTVISGCFPMLYIQSHILIPQFLSMIMAALQRMYITAWAANDLKEIEGPGGTAQYQAAPRPDEVDCKVHETLAHQEWTKTWKKPAKHRLVIIFGNITTVVTSKPLAG
ncbi:hypothetical protein G5I_11034 [Acromyrmex echinatior]|uniref:Uncharacterized protein n=1 Tax=Acromyrmex echinatior TaxID=103372 RepID=F4WYI1_ACREC|nr:hypothetical protein G5I_11034 [Acromyrmex echinatior]